MELQKESVEIVRDPETLNIMRFLLMNGFNHVQPDVLESTADLIFKGIRGGLSTMEKEYAILAKKSCLTADGIRVKLSYYINDNTENVRASIQQKYDYDIGPYFGVKNFIIQMVFVYTLFTRK